jgi:hypothetical protein
LNDLLFEVLRFHAKYFFDVLERQREAPHHAPLHLVGDDLPDARLAELQPERLLGDTQLLCDLLVGEPRLGEHQLGDLTTAHLSGDGSNTLVAHAVSSDASAAR